MAKQSFGDLVISLRGVSVRYRPDHHSFRCLVDALPALRIREALIVGEGTTVPVRILFDEIPEVRQPRSANVPFSTAWKAEEGDDMALNEAIRRWREQDRSSTDGGI